MVNKCVIYGCKSEYKSNVNSVPSFHFPLQKVDLLAKWTKFVNHLDWSLISNSVICANHFDQKFILNGKRKKLNWKLNPVPTIYPESVLSKPSSLPTLTGFRKSPKPRIYQPDQVNSFVEKDKIHNIEDITEKHCPFGCTWHKTKYFILLYVLLFDDCSGFPTICEFIKIDNSLHVEFQYCNNPVPLPD